MMMLSGWPRRRDHDRERVASEGPSTSAFPQMCIVAFAQFGHGMCNSFANDMGAFEINACN